MSNLNIVDLGPVGGGYIISGGGSNREILSVKQADRIMQSLNSVMALCKSKLEEKNDDFVKRVSQVWEDKNAVEYMKHHKIIFDDIIDQLSDNASIFGERLQEIVEAYIRAGGMSVHMNETPAKFNGNVDVSKVQEFFEDGNGDDFGFKDPVTGPDQVMESFTSLKNAATSIINSAVSEIKSINAFGNQDVRNNLAVSAGEIVSVFKKRIEKDSQRVKEYLDETALAYKNLGSNSASVAKIASN